MREKTSRRRSLKEIAQIRKEDAEIQLLEDLSSQLPSILHEQSSDAEIAAEVENRFGIPADLILKQFASEDEADFSTYELIVRAYEENK